MANLMVILKMNLNQRIICTVTESDSKLPKNTPKDTIY